MKTIIKRPGSGWSWSIGHGPDLGLRVEPVIISKRPECTIYSRASFDTHHFLHTTTLPTYSFSLSNSQGFWGFGVLGFWGFGEIGRAHV